MLKKIEEIAEKNGAFGDEYEKMRIEFLMKFEDFVKIDAIEDIGYEYEKED